MKPTIRLLLCTATVLSALCLHLPAVRADETSDYLDQIYRDQQERDDYLNQLQETSNYVDQIYQDQRDLDDYLNKVQETNDYVDQIYRDQQEREK